MEILELAQRLLSRLEVAERLNQPLDLLEHRVLLLVADSISNLSPIEVKEEMIVDKLLLSPNPTHNTESYSDLAKAWLDSVSSQNNEVKSVPLDKDGRRTDNWLDEIKRNREDDGGNH